MRQENLEDNYNTYWPLIQGMLYGVGTVILGLVGLCIFDPQGKVFEPMREETRRVNAEVERRQAMIEAQRRGPVLSIDLEPPFRKIEHEDGILDYNSGAVLARRLGYNKELPRETRFEIVTSDKRRSLKAYISRSDDQGTSWTSIISMPERGEITEILDVGTDY